jgi:hypothetical protein
MSSRMLCLILVAVLFNLAMPTAHADANESATWQGTRFGVPVWVTVVPRGHDIPADARAHDPWWRWGNTMTDVYLFAFERQENVRVILEFQPEPDGLPEARLYLNKMGRERVDYTLEGDDLQVRSSGGHPLMRIQPQGGPWMIDDQTNYNLHILVDGRLPPGGGSHPIDTDGTVDWDIRVGGAHPGVADWETARLVNDPRPKWGYPRFSASQRQPDGPAFKAEAPFMPTFPHFTTGLGQRLSTDQVDGAIDWYRENPRPLYYDMRAQQLELYPLPGFQNGGMYDYYSIAPPPAVNFESPFAFYSFDLDSRYPQLLVRGGKSPAGDLYVNQALTGVMDRTSFRYSWKVEDGLVWRYSLDVAGSYPYTQTVQIGNTQILGIPPRDLPSWVVSKPWPLATFVEAVEGYPGSEGIYFYTAQAQENRPWLDGTSDDPPPHLDRPYLAEDPAVTRGSDLSLPPGFRGESSSTYFQKPTVYFSPIDNRAHLLYAQTGIWNLGHNRILRMHNLDGGAHINGWTREIVPDQPAPPPPPNGRIQPDATRSDRALPGEVEEALYAFDGYLIYSGPQGTELRQAAFTPALFTTQPPTDRDTWLAFRERVQSLNGQERNPEDLRSWLNAFQGTPTIVSGGKIEGVRAIKGGFRFVVDLQAGFQIQGIEATQAIHPGKYVVTYDGKLRIEPLTPPALSARLRELQPTALAMSRIQVLLGNSGRQDLAGGTLEIWAAPAHSAPELVMTRTVDLLAGEPITVSLEWVPRSEGDWTLMPKIRQAGDHMLTFPPTQVSALPARSASSEALIVASTSGLRLPYILLVLVTFSTVGALVIRRQLNVTSEEHRDDTR